MSLIRLQPQLQLMGYEVATYGVQVAAYGVPHNTSTEVASSNRHIHLESPQFKHVLQPSSMTKTILKHCMDILQLIKSLGPKGRR
jgi:hypothetical protein